MNRAGRNLWALGSVALASRHLAYPLVKKLYTRRAPKILAAPAQTTAAAEPTSHGLPDAYESLEAMQAKMREDVREVRGRACADGCAGACFCVSGSHVVCAGCSASTTAAQPAARVGSVLTCCTIVVLRAASACR